MTSRKDAPATEELARLNGEYADLVGEPAYLYASDPAGTGVAKQMRYTFQGRPVAIGPTEALATMRELLDQARSGYAWTGRTIAEFQAEKAAMERAHRNS